MNIPVLLAANQRLLLWGNTITADTIKVELFYCDVQLPKSLSVSTRSGDRTYKVEIPEPLQGQIFPRKGIGLTLKIL